MSITRNRKLSKENEEKMKNFFDQVVDLSKHFVGYPQNLAFEFPQELMGLMKYHLNNIGDPFVPGHFSLHSREFEQSVLSYRAQKYSLFDKNPAGYIGCSGTESNMRGLYIAKKSYHNQGILYYSTETHYSIKKAADLMSIETEVVKSLPNGEIDYDDLAKCLKKHIDKPAILNLNIGTTVKGATDNLDKVIEILKKLKIKDHHIHLDCALSGGFLPFLVDSKKPDIGFHKPIKSLAISGHKFIGSPIPCGIVLARKEVADLVKEENNSSYIGSPDTTIMGSRSGHAPLFLRYSLLLLGDEGMKQRVQQCFENTNYFNNKLKDKGIQTLLNPYSLTVVFPKPSEMIIKKWSLATKDQLSHLIAVSHVTKPIIDSFLEELLQDSGVYRTLVL